jgi:hypothetical protein
MSLPSLPAIAALQDYATRLWHENAGAQVPTASELDEAILAQHRANYELWHIEDEARTPGIDDAALARTKRSIDVVNQKRNDLAERCDALLLELLAPLRLPHPTAELHSESPGLMIDRLSILALKLFHTREELERTDAPGGHAQRNQQRLGVLLQQRSDLQQALETLWRRVLATERRFKVYRQLKMYNDPSLNPSVYGSALKPRS